MQDALELMDWRRQIAELYAQVRAEPQPADGHRIWRAGSPIARASTEPFGA